tara:strand:- start:1774 stop:2439 length:666 start_codon:yes stop_codon:yes gene_type:complete
LRTGIQGGTFDPIHFGHLSSAEDVSFQLELDRVIFVPSGTPPHKSSPLMASSVDRLDMVEMAIEGHPLFRSDSVELDREGLSFTVDTLRILANTSCKGDEIFFIIGEDAFLNLHTWKDPLEVLEKVNFAVTIRQMSSAKEIMLELKKRFEDLSVRFDFNFLFDNRCRILNSNMFIEFIPIRRLDISSSDIRENIQNSRSIRYLLPRTVERFIIDKKLYKDS